MGQEGGALCLEQQVVSTSKCVHLPVGPQIFAASRFTFFYCLGSFPMFRVKGIGLEWKLVKEMLRCCWLSIYFPLHTTDFGNCELELS